MPLRVTTPGTYNPVTGEETGETVAEYGCSGLLKPASKGTIESFDVRFESGTMIEENLRAVVLVAYGLPVVPHGGDTLIVHGVPWNVLGCTPVSPDGATYLLFNLGVKRA